MIQTAIRSSIDHHGARSGIGIVLLSLILLLVLLPGCDDSVDPIVSSDRQVTLFGTLDMNTDMQFVRFIPIRETIDPINIDPANYTFRSTDLTDDIDLDWSDSLVTFGNGSVGLFFYAHTRMRPGHTYAFEATKSGSSLVTSAVTTVPSLPVVTVAPENVRRFTSGSGFQVIGSQKLTWEGLEQEPYSVKLFYRFLRTPFEPFRDVQVRTLPPFTYEDNTLSITLDLVADRFLVDDSLDINQYALMGIGMEVTSLDDQFVPPGGIFDPEILVQPGTFSNVTNGFGFIGSVGRFRREWSLSEESTRTLGFRTPGDLFGKASNIPGPGIAKAVISAAR